MSAPKPRRFISYIVGRMVCEDRQIARIICDAALEDLRDQIMDRYGRELAQIAEQEDMAQSDEE